LKNPLSDALSSSVDLPKAKGAVAIRKAFDQFLLMSAEVTYKCSYNIISTDL
jgi:hypothetical protein